MSKTGNRGYDRVKRVQGLIEVGVICEVRSGEKGKGGDCKIWRRVFLLVAGGGNAFFSADLVAVATGVGRDGAFFLWE